MKKMAFFCLLVGLGLFIGENESAFAQSELEKRIIVTFEEKVNEQEAKQMIERAGGDMEQMYDQVGAALIQIPAPDLAALEGSPFVKQVEEDTVLYLHQQVEDWGLQTARIPEAWQSGFTGKGIKVAVIDSGIAPHSDLEVKGGISTVAYTASYADDNGHGTHVAGIIGARNNDIGVKGAAYESEVYAVKAFNQNGAAYLSDIIEGIDWSIASGMDIINLSAGTQVESTAFRSVIDKAYQHGLLIVAAAGNDGASDGSGDTVDFPARYLSVIGVGAIDSQFNRASFSSTGPDVEVAAPGVSIVSTYLGNAYAYMSGTSMAAPYVTGQLALLKQAYPNLSHQELRQLLVTYTRDLGEAGRDPFFGYGVIQANPFTQPANSQEQNKLTGLTLSTASFTGKPGDIVQVTASATYENGDVLNVTNDATWTSANPEVAATANGRVELRNYGSTSITVSYQDQSAVLMIDVPAPTPKPNPVVKLDVGPTNIVGQPGETMQARALATYENGDARTVTNEAAWVSENSQVAVAENGNIQFTGYGSTIVTVTYQGQSTKIVVNSPVPQASPQPVTTPQPSPEPVPTPTPSPEEELPFIDVPRDYKAAVDYLIRRDITQGITKNEFGVSKDIVRADAAIWLAKQLQLNTSSAPSSGFTDVPDRAAGAVNALKSAGIIGGKTATSFGARDLLTRGEVALILQRAYKLSGESGSSSFTDVPPRYQEAVNALVANRITYGLTATKFGVSSHITRGQLAIFLYRLSAGS